MARGKKSSKKGFRSPCSFKFYSKNLDSMRAALKARPTGMGFTAGCHNSTDHEKVKEIDNGIMVNGGPIGGENFVKDELKDKMLKIQEKMVKVIKYLKPINCQALTAIAGISFTGSITHLCQMMNPTVMNPIAETFDKALLNMWSEGTGIDTDNMSDFTSRRVALPISKGGAAMRRYGDFIGDAAFTANYLKLGPKMLDKKDKNGVVTDGFMNSALILGPGSFDEGNEGKRFEKFYEHSTGKELKDSWQRLQKQATPSDREKPVKGGLASPPEGAGGHINGNQSPWQTDKVQKEITEAIEEIRHQRLVEEAGIILTQDTHNREAASFIQSDRFARAIINSLPYAGEEVGNADYHSAIATYLGLPINYLKGYVGKQFKSARGTTSKIDEHGEELINANLKGGGSWKQRHDYIQRTISRMLGEAGIRHKMEPQGLFSGCFPPEDAKTHQALVPDFMIEDVGGTHQKIAELKTVHYSDKSKFYSKTKIRISGAPVSARARVIVRKMRFILSEMSGLNRMFPFIGKLIFGNYWGLATWIAIEER